MTRNAVIALSAAFAALCLAAPAGGVFAQDKGVAIEPYRLPLTDKAVLAKASALKEAGKLLSADRVSAGLKSPTPAALKLAPVSTTPLAPREIAARAR